MKMLKKWSGNISANVDDEYTVSVETIQFKREEVVEDEVYFLDYDVPNAFVSIYTTGATLDVNDIATASLYNSYINAFITAEITHELAVGYYAFACYAKFFTDIKAGELMYNRYRTQTLKDIDQFNSEQIKSKKRIYIVVADEDKVDFKALSKYGKITKLPIDQILQHP